MTAVQLDVFAARDEAIAHATDADRDGWDRAVIDQAIRAKVDAGVAFSANDIRDLLPNVRKALIGARFLSWSMRKRDDGLLLLEKVGEVVSTDGPTHGKRINVYRVRGNAA